MSNSTSSLFVIAFNINKTRKTLLSQNANDRGQFVIIKTKLTTKGREECKEKRDYIYVARG
jgi:hypothetical protein